MSTPESEGGCISAKNMTDAYDALIGNQRKQIAMLESYMNLIENCVPGLTLMRDDNDHIVGWHFDETQ